jgi:hypothetical protein
VRINALVAKAQKTPEEGWVMPDGTQWPGNNPRDHPGMIQVICFLTTQRSYGSIVLSKPYGVIFSTNCMMLPQFFFEKGSPSLCINRCIRPFIKKLFKVLQKYLKNHYIIGMRVLKCIHVIVLKFTLPFGLQVLYNTCFCFHSMI